jgi:hypothetical protein
MVVSSRGSPQREIPTFSTLNSSLNSNALVATWSRRRAGLDLGNVSVLGSATALSSAEKQRRYRERLAAQTAERPDVIEAALLEEAAVPVATR